MIHQMEWYYNEDGDIFWECQACEKVVKHPAKGEPEILVKGDQTAIHRGSVGMSITGIDFTYGE